MKRTIAGFFAIIGLFLAGCAEKSQTVNSSGPLYRCHFIGMTQLNQSTNAAKVREVWSLPSSGELRKKALDKISQTPFQLWQKSLPTGVTNQPGLIRPLIDDFLTAESYVEINGEAANYDSVVALQLEDQRARLWETNLWQLLLAWKLPAPQPLASGAGSGWESRGSGVTVQLQRRGKWLLAGWSLGKISALSSMAELLEKANAPASPTNAILELEANLPALARWSPILEKHRLPPVALTVAPRGEYIRTEAKLSLSEALAWKFRPWHIPTNLIGEPLMSFTVAQGIDPLLNSMPGFTELDLKPAPSEVCAWGLNGPYSSFWAFPTEHASNVLRRLGPKMPGFIKHYIEDPPGQMVYATNTAELAWTGMPFMVPVIRSTNDGPQEYLVAGLVPPRRVFRPAPAELLGQLSNRTDLLYYDWEITQNRFDQARQVYQIIDMAHTRMLGNTNDATSKWHQEAAPRLGNTITELSMTSPKELKFVRKSHIGFTGFELETILRWINGSTFPLGYEPPPSALHKPRQTPTPPPRTNQPARVPAPGQTSRPPAAPVK